MITVDDYLEVAARYDHPMDAYRAARVLDETFGPDVLTGFAFFVKASGETRVFLTFAPGEQAAAKKAERLLGSASAEVNQSVVTVRECYEAYEHGEFAFATAGILEAFAPVAQAWPPRSGCRSWSCASSTGAQANAIELQRVDE
jgi:hypothetical protein